MSRGPCHQFGTHTHARVREGEELRPLRPSGRTASESGHGMAAKDATIGKMKIWGGARPYQGGGSTAQPLNRLRINGPQLCAWMFHAPRHFLSTSRRLGGDGQEEEGQGGTSRAPLRLRPRPPRPLTPTDRARGPRASRDPGVGGFVGFQA